MDLTWSAEEEAFRAEARAWLEANLAAWRAAAAGDPVGRHAPRGSPSTSSGSGGCSTTGWAVVSWPEEYGGRGRVAVGVADLRGGVLPGRRAAAGHPERHLPAGADASSSSARRRAAGPHPAPHGRGRGPVVPGLVRAQRGQRPRRHHARRAHDEVDGGWRAQRPEDLDDPRRVLHAPVRPVPHRPRQPSATGASPTSSCRSTPPGVTVRGFGRLDGDEGFAEVFFDDAFVPDDACPAASCSARSTRAGRVAMATTSSERGLTLRSPGPLPRRPPTGWSTCTAQPSAATTRAAPRPGRRRRGWRPRRTGCRRCRPSPRRSTGDPPAPSRASSRSGGPSSTSSCTRPRSTCSAPTPSSTARGRKGYAVRAVRPDLRRHQRDPAQRRRRARARPAEEVAACGSPSPTTSSRSATPCATCWPRSARPRWCAPPGRRPDADGQGPAPALAPTPGRLERLGSTSPRWACSASPCPRPTAASASTRSTAALLLAEETGYAALPHPVVEAVCVVAPGLAATRPPAPRPGRLGPRRVVDGADASTGVARPRPARAVAVGRLGVRAGGARHRRPARRPRPGACST